MITSAPNDNLLKVGARQYRAFAGPPHRYDPTCAMMFHLLTTLGLHEHHKVLDIGCGSLQIGRPLIRYPTPGNYKGIEPQQWALFHTDGDAPGWLHQGVPLSWKLMSKHFKLRKGG